jgi:hypothetical protein
MYLIIAFYGALAGVALWATWHDIHLRTIGAVLIIDWLISNAAWFSGDSQTRAGVYTMLEILVSASAYIAFAFCKSAVTRWTLIGVVTVSVFSCGCNIVFASIIAPVPFQKYIYDVATNLCFAAECLLATGAGIHDGLGIGRLDHWLPRRRHLAASDALPAEGREP